MKFLRTITVCAFLLAGLMAQEYSWPTANGIRVASNFGEFRDDHFHMGLDISTFGQTGKPAYAIADGHISKIVARFTGYGKAIYIAHSDGRQSVFGHLDRFSPMLEEILRNQQRKEKTYSVKVNFSPTDFPVKKGDLIGYVGNSGGSYAAHLHFELRDENDITINPLQNGLPIPDSRSPVIESIAINPLEDGTLINSSPLPQTFTAYRDPSGIFHLPDTINCTGVVGFSIKTHDRVQGVRYKYNIHKIILALDGVPQFSLTYDSLDFDQERLLTIVEDHRLQRLFKEDYHKLYRIAGYPDVTVHDGPGHGRLELPPGHHTLEITVIDNGGNSSLLKGTLLNLPPIALKIAAVKQVGSTVSFEIEPAGTAIPITGLTCYSFTPFGYYDSKVKPKTFEAANNKLLVTYPLKSIKNRVLQFIGINKMGVFATPYHWHNLVEAKNPNEVVVSLEMSHTEAGVFLQVSTSEFVLIEPTVSLNSKMTNRPVKITRVQPNVYLSDLIVPEAFSSTDDIVVKFDGNPNREVRFAFQGAVARPGNSTAVVTSDRRCSLQALPGSFFDTTMVWIRPAPENDFKSEENLLSRVYQLQPFDIPVRDSVRVAIRYESAYADLDRKALYYIDGKGEWKYLPTKHNAERQTMMATLTSLESVAILRDTLAPVIKSTFPANGGHYHYQDLETIHGFFEDELAGIDASENDMFLMMDGKLLLFAYQPIEKKISYRFDAPLEEGAHELVFSVTDRVGNSTVKKVNFTVN